MHGKWFLWLLPAVLTGLGVYYSTVPIADFLAAACFAFAVLIAVALLLPTLQKRHPKAAKILVGSVLCVVALGLLLMTVTGIRIAKAGAEEADTPCPYILVLGAKVNGDTPSRSLQCRIDAAYAYLSAHPETVAILSGGQGSDETVTEAACMFAALTALGISEDRLWLEENATSTWENITFSLDLIEGRTGQRPETVGLVTSEFHLYRAGLFAADCGVEIVGIPGETMKKSEYVYYFLREIAGVWHYIILGGLYHD